METLHQDIRYTLRQWRRAPGFLLFSILTVALGSGGVTTMMSIIDAVLLRSLAGVRDPEGLVEIRVGDRAGRSRRPMSFAAFEALRRSDTGLTEFAGGDYAEMSVSAGRDGIPELVSGVTASGNLFSVLRTRPALGRFFTEEEGTEATALPVVVMSHSFWMARFGGDPTVLGTTLSINRTPFTIIGVAEEGFHGHLPLYDFSLFVPLGMRETLTGERHSDSALLTIGRLAPGVPLARVREATSGVVEELRTQDPAEWFSSVFVVEPHTRSFQEFRGPVSLFLGFLLVLSGCILLITCANLAGLILARAMSRTHEVAVRKALGASRRRLVNQLLTETLLLFFLGGVGGAVLAYWATAALARIPIPLGVPLTGAYQPDLRVLTVSMALTLSSGILFGLTPALRSTRGDVGTVLRDHRGEAPTRQRLRSILVVAQVVGAVVLLGGGGTLFRALQKAASLDLGFDPAGVHVATVNLRIQQYGEEDGRIFLSRLLEGGIHLPGVESAALADFLFLASPPERSGTFSSAEGEESVMAGVFGVSPDFFQTVRLDVLEGRPFDASDTREGEPVAMVNEAVAGILWPNESPVGQYLRDGDSIRRVVGLVRNSRYISIGESPLAGVLRPQQQHYVPTTSLILRVRDGWPDLRREVAALVRDLDPEVPLGTNEPYPSLVASQFLPRRLAAGFAGALGGLGVLLTSVGLFGVLSHSVVQRSSELAVRIALGANPTTLRWSVIRSGMTLVLLGIAVGIPLALSLSFLIRGFLYGMDPLDPTTFCTIAIFLALVGFAAGHLPALQATRTDPALVLRQK